MHNPVGFETPERFPSAEDECLLQANATGTACNRFIGANGVPVSTR
jgi:hypothetical protein